MSDNKDTAAARLSPSSDAAARDHGNPSALNPAERDTGQLLQDALREILLALTNRATAARIVKVALSTSGSASLPVEPQTMRSFVRGPLFDAASALVSRDVAQSLVETLGPILALAQRAGAVSRTRAKARAESAAPTTRPRIATDSEPTTSLVPLARPNDARTTSWNTEFSLDGEPVEFTVPVPESWVIRVLVTTQSVERAKALQMAFRAGYCEFVILEDAVALLQELESEEPPQAVVIDCVHPSVQAATMLTLAEDLSPASQVILWGLTEAMSDTLGLLGTLTERWVRTDADADAATVATTLESLLSDPMGGGA